MPEKLAWSCDEKDRNACRNSHGCHCREITDLQEQVRGKDVTVAAAMKLIRRLEREQRRAALAALGKDASRG